MYTVSFLKSQGVLAEAGLTISGCDILSKEDDIRDAQGHQVTYETAVSQIETILVEKIFEESAQLGTILPNAMAGLTCYTVADTLDKRAHFEKAKLLLTAMDRQSPNFKLARNYLVSYTGTANDAILGNIFATGCDTASANPVKLGSWEEFSINPPRLYKSPDDL